MLPSTFNNLLRLIGPTLVEKKNLFSDPLPPALCLAVALRYLASGDSQISLSYNFKIWEIVCPIAVKVPERKDDWKTLAKDFWNLWGFPHCLGAIDGKHCVITCPQNLGSAFYNYIGSFSIGLWVSHTVCHNLQHQHTCLRMLMLEIMADSVTHPPKHVTIAF